MERNAEKLDFRPLRKRAENALSGMGRDADDLLPSG
jgi:hypothetical protein